MVDALVVGKLLDSIVLYLFSSPALGELGTMRKPETIEKLYLDFDGFFASVMQQAVPGLRGKPVGVIPFETSAAYSTVVIACSKEAKAAGCKLSSAGVNCASLMVIRRAASGSSVPVVPGI